MYIGIFVHTCVKLNIYAPNIELYTTKNVISISLVKCLGPPSSVVLFSVYEFQSGPLFTNNAHCLLSKHRDLKIIYLT